jgi:hypothetical protein
MSDVAAGQIWRDNDKRMAARYILVLRIEGDKAVCVSCSETGNVLTQRQTRIALRRFKPNSTGYVFVRPKT